MFFDLLNPMKFNVQVRKKNFVPITRNFFSCLQNFLPQIISVDVFRPLETNELQCWWPKWWKFSLVSDYKGCWCILMTQRNMRNLEIFGPKIFTTKFFLWMFFDLLNPMKFNVQVRKKNFVPIIRKKIFVSKKLSSPNYFCGRFSTLRN